MSVVERVLRGRVVPEQAWAWGARDVRFCADAGIVLDLGPASVAGSDEARTPRAGTEVDGAVVDHGAAGAGTDDAGVDGSWGADTDGGTGDGTADAGVDGSTGPGVDGSTGDEAGVDGSTGDEAGVDGSTGVDAGVDAEDAGVGGGVGARLRGCLGELGLGAGVAELFAVAAETVGALGGGGDLARVAAASAASCAASADGGVAGSVVPVAASTAAEAVAAEGLDGPGDGSGGGSSVGAEDLGAEDLGGEDLGARVAGASGVLGLVGALTGLSAHLDGALTSVVGDLCVRNGRILLARRGVADPAGLSPNQASRWRGRAKGATRREVGALTGWGEGEVADLVALACAPAGVAGPVVSAMGQGVVPWRLARRFFREFGTDAHQDAADVARSLFGTEADTVCTDRLDPDGGLKDGPWEHKLFYRAVERERARLDSADPHAAAEARARARERRDVRATVEDDGTGSVCVNGTATQVAAVMDRLEKGARAARAAGDPRTLAKLRADLAMSLLLHSGLDLPAPPGDGQVVSTAWTEQMAAVLAALPRAVLNVIVPFDAFVHSPTRPLFDLPTTDPTDQPDDPTGAPAGDPGPGPASTEPPGDPGPAPGPSPAGGWPPGSAFFPPGHQAPPPPGAQAPGPVGASPPGTAPSGARGGPVGAVGAVTGAFPFFLTADAVRELALAPGTTLYRLLTDAADGRCVERSIGSYAPDAAMRAQVHAADVTCRAPGCTQHAPYTQLDHVVAHGTDGGATAETNLQDLHTGHHDPKTKKEWTAVMAPNRDVTWTSLLGRIYRTRAHDYRQYSTLLTAALDQVRTETDQALAADARARADTHGQPTGRARGRTGQEPQTREQALTDAVDRAVYRALTYRGPAQLLRGGDDHPGADTDPGFLAWDTIDLTHRGPDGRRRHGPDPTTAQTEHDTQHHPDEPGPDDPDSTSPQDTHHEGTSPQGGGGTSNKGTTWATPNDEPPPF